LQDELLKHSHAKKQNSSEYANGESESVSSSSKAEKKNHRKNVNQQNSQLNIRSAQLLTLEKRQL
jgi:hypothetical protein